MSRKLAAARDLPIVPQRCWNDLFGFDETLGKLRLLLREGRCPQVLLLEGREGIGKRKLLSYVCGLLGCEQKSACGACDGCQAIQAGFQPDFLWMESEGAMKVADADAIQQHLVYRASGSLAAGSERVVVIVDIENLTDQAANRLLKTLEEPPAGTRILLSCSRPRQLLPTIASRLVRWRLGPPAIELSLAWLRKQLPELEEALIRESLIAQGLSPGLTLGRLSRQKSQIEAWQRMEQLLLAAGPSQEMQELIKTLAWKAPELAQQCELLLNRQYRQSLGLQRQADGVTPVPLQLIRQRRRVLQQIYRAGGSGHNYLNTQMAAEAWASKNGEIG